jgi:hypothetical protein
MSDVMKIIIEYTPAGESTCIAAIAGLDLTVMEIDQLDVGPLLFCTGKYESD